MWAECNVVFQNDKRARYICESNNRDKQNVYYQIIVKVSFPMKWNQTEEGEGDWWNGYGIPVESKLLAGLSEWYHFFKTDSKHTHTTHHHIIFNRLFFFHTLLPNFFSFFLLTSLSLLSLFSACVVIFFIFIFLLPSSFLPPFHPLVISLLFWVLLFLSLLYIYFLHYGFRLTLKVWRSVYRYLFRCSVPLVYYRQNECWPPASTYTHKQSVGHYSTQCLT